MEDDVITWEEIETRAIAFHKRWKDAAGDERQEAVTFEKDFMDIFGVDWREGLHEYQIRDQEGRLCYIDYLLPGKILIEMKSKGESLIRAYNQGIHYVKSLKPEEQPELLLVSDFELFQLTNLRLGKTFNAFRLRNLKDRLKMFGLLAGLTTDTEFQTHIQVNVDAGYKMSKLHDALKEGGYEGEALEVYLVRLLFCLFAEDTGIFEKQAFEDYLKESAEDGSDLSMRLTLLFEMLDTPEEKRMAAHKERFRQFRYINGEIFAKSLPTAWFNEKMRQTLLDCCDFDWSYISPAVFGAMFQGVLDPEARREMGAHYTSEDNIMKLIKPLFLDELWDQFEKAKTTKAELRRFHEKLASLRFLDMNTMALIQAVANR